MTLYAWHISYITLYAVFSLLLPPQAGLDKQRMIETLGRAILEVVS
jgi:hypothetical protein